MTKLDELFAEYGQSPWIDNIRRDWLNDGTLAGMVAEGVRGVESRLRITHRGRGIEIGVCGLGQQAYDQGSIVCVHRVLAPTSCS